MDLRDKYYKIKIDNYRIFTCFKKLTEGFNNSLSLPLSRFLLLYSFPPFFLLPFSFTDFLSSIVSFTFLFYLFSLILFFSFLSLSLIHSLSLSPSVFFFTLSFNHTISLPSPPLSLLPAVIPLLCLFRFFPLFPPRIPYLFFLFVCYVRLCTAGNRLSVYSGSVSAVLRASPLPRISRKTTRFIHGKPSLRSFCGHTSLKLNSPSIITELTFHDPCDTDSLGFFKGWLIF